MGHYKYSYTINFIATFNVQCELCGNSFTFEDERVASSGYSCYGANQAINEASANMEKIKKALQSGYYGTGAVSLSKLNKCPHCGYYQSWMVPALKLKEYTHYFLRMLPWLLMFFTGICTGWILPMYLMEEYTLPLIRVLWITPLAVIMFVFGFIRALKIKREYLKYDPNAEVLQGRPAPTENHLPQISFRPGRLTEPLF